jgi:hypothetical protein
LVADLEFSLTQKKWIKLHEERTKAESKYHSGLTPARKTQKAVRLDLLTVVFPMVVTARCSIVGEGRGRVEREGYGGYVPTKRQRGSS